MGMYTRIKYARVIDSTVWYAFRGSSAFRFPTLYSSKEGSYCVNRAPPTSPPARTFDTSSTSVPFYRAPLDTGSIFESPEQGGVTFSHTTSALIYLNKLAREPPCKSIRVAVPDSRIHAPRYTSLEYTLT